MKSKSCHIKEDKKCRTRYQCIGRELFHYGINADEVWRSANILSENMEGTRLLKPETYRPTGIALGAPLPTRSNSERIWRVVRLLDRQISKLIAPTSATIALVPKDWYHVTIVNKTHYETTNISKLSEHERDQAADILHSLHTAPLKIQFSGLLLTTNGRLIIPGYPHDLKFYEMRHDLSKKMPQLRSSLPITVHIKIGHLLVNINHQQLLRTMAWLYRFSIHLNFVEAFDIYHTPCGTIS